MSLGSTARATSNFHVPLEIPREEDPGGGRPAVSLRVMARSAVEITVGAGGRAQTRAGPAVARP